MKLNLHSRRHQWGSTLLLSMVIASILGFVMVAYLKLVRAQNMSTVRSQVWNGAIPVIEAGVEDAMAHLGAHTGADLACDGWWSHENRYWMFRRIGENFYIVTISNYVAGVNMAAPIIESRGYVNMPTVGSCAPAGPMLADAVQSDSYAYRRYLGRGVRVQTRSDSMFTKGLVARDTIDMNGNNIRTDSFDSTDPNYSTNGKYDASKKRANGDIATDSSLINSVDIGNADIFGHVSTGPNGSVAIGSQGAVGDLAWHAGNHKGIQPGFYTDDMNVDFPDVELPFTGGYLLPAGGTITNADGSTTYYEYVLDDGNYQLATFSSTMYVRGNAVLVITSGISMSGHDEIRIGPGHKLDLYMAGAQASLNGQGVANMNGNATNFAYYGLPNNTSISLSGNSEFSGTIYAPNAAISLSGGGNNETDFIGAAITRSATLNGHYNFHYDEALGKQGLARGYVVTSWDEMRPEEFGQTQITLTW